MFNDLDWVPANHLQAEDRAYRIGQTGTVNATYLLARDTLDEFVAGVLAVKTGLIDAVVEGGELPDGDVLRELESLVQSISPGLEDGGDDAAVERLLREAVRAYEARHADERARSEAGAGPRSGLPADAIEALIRAISGEATTRYGVASNSRPDVVYTLEVDGPDVICSCPGFEYRGSCTHARQLKSALATGEALPAGFEAVGAHE